jgi:hypothetical protein
VEKTGNNDEEAEEQDVEEKSGCDIFLIQIHIGLSLG